MNAKANAKLKAVKRRLNPAAAFDIEQTSAPDTVPHFSVVTNDNQEKMLITSYRSEPPPSECEVSDTDTLEEEQTKHVSAVYPNYEEMVHRQHERVKEYQVDSFIIGSFSQSHVIFEDKNYIVHS